MSFYIFQKLSKQKKLGILKFRNALIEEPSSVDLGTKTLAPSTTPSEYNKSCCISQLGTYSFIDRNVPRYLHCRVCTQEKKRVTFQM